MHGIFIINLRPKVTLADIDKLRDFLTTIGDCVLVIGDLDLVKVHVHTNRPDLAMKNALKLGELDSVKVENMVEQNRVLNEKRESEKAEMKEYGIISVCSGKGMEAIFNDLGIDKIVEGGQTMNPSVYDILSTINEVNAKRYSFCRTIKISFCPQNRRATLRKNPFSSFRPATLRKVSPRRLRLCPRQARKKTSRQ